ncbi:hypothetical protein KCG48_10640 [Proteiniclasticum sp. BAD-10]|uniref:Uncharacterized protein n=1 Tax=Proteiniclasticum sediminis TaxID=2804028 RepID=A0A941HRA2_9CLOT|nr:hypothetical protein [Proteiniclasticum sediminis]MBR0576790.1 hypothetical protein [Proteiniclasticum sediminis]
MDNLTTYLRVGAFIELETELFNNTEVVNKYLAVLEYSEDTLYQLKLANIYSWFVALKSFVIQNEEFGHHDVLGLLRSWEELYLQMEDVVEEIESPNTTWLSTAYERYESLHQTVDRMFREHYSELKP